MGAAVQCFPRGQQDCSASTVWLEDQTPSLTSRPERASVLSWWLGHKAAILGRPGLRAEPTPNHTKQIVRASQFCLQ